MGRGAPPSNATSEEPSARLDVWLWRARFGKTRSAATAFVTKSGVRITAGGETRRVTKPATPVRPGDVLTFVRAKDMVRLRILSLGERRGPAGEARGLYEPLADPENNGNVEPKRGAERPREPKEPAMTSDDLYEARVSATALLVEAALADGIYADIESDMITAMVTDTFGLDAKSTAKLIDDAEQRAEASVDHHRFTRVVKTLPLAEREKFIESLWRVVFADGEEDAFEEAFVRKIADLVAVDPRIARLARKRVREGGAGDAAGES